MPEVVEVKIDQSCARTGPLKGMPHVVVAPAVNIMEDPGDVLPSPKAAEQAPQRFIERQRPRLPVLRLLEADKPMRHVDRLPGETKQFPLPHPGGRAGPQ